MASETVQVNLRMPQSAIDQLKADAKANGRSVNKEAVARLEAYLAAMDARDALRDDFAKAAMQVILAATARSYDHDGKTILSGYINADGARLAYAMADHMLAARGAA